MLKVQTNVCRSAVNIDGIWRFKTVDDGFLPVEPLKEYRLMPVPASMNDVVTEYDLREYVGKVAYETLFSCPVNFVYNVTTATQKAITRYTLKL